MGRGWTVLDTEGSRAHPPPARRLPGAELRIHQRPWARLHVLPPPRDEARGVPPPSIIKPVGQRPGGWAPIHSVTSFL